MVNFTTQDHALDKALDMMLTLALDPMQPVVLGEIVINTNRTVGTMLSCEVSRRYGSKSLPEYIVRIKLTGSAGQRPGTFLAPAVAIDVAVTPTTTSGRTSAPASSSRTRRGVLRRRRSQHGHAQRVLLRRLARQSVRARHGRRALLRGNSVAIWWRVWAATASTSGRRRRHVWRHRLRHGQGGQ
jgi:hypothetical protein